ncbi:MAG: DNA repair protein RadC [Marinilabiliaceae bacterium]|jgi:DNA repair protein RadC|nr:DNA repair protein RadC [Marinilabiliaceae bacterium]
MSLKIKEWALEDRPREKLLYKGIFSLSDAELLAILLGSGNTEQSAVDLARDVLKLADNNLVKLGKLGIDDLQKLKGVGVAKAINIMAALELGRRRKSSDINDEQVIRSSTDVYNIFHPLLSDLNYEEFWLIYLNRSNRIISRLKISQGGISGTITDVRLIMKKALELLASSIIICHNHPSGNSEPSEADRRITAKIKDAAAYFDISLLDHLIVTQNSYYSFADKGEL